jgi:aspartate dehydrogenase
VQNRTGITVGAALVPRPPPDPLDDNIQLFLDVAELIAWKPSLVVECASHEAVRTSVPRLLQTGIDVVVVSIGALGSKETMSLLEKAAGEGNAHLSIASGAIGGLDVLRAARLAGLDEVIYKGRKPPQAWIGSPAEERVDLGDLSELTIFFEGSAAESSALFPKNANVTAAVALAGIGFEKTRVQLVADPTASGNVHEVSARGAFGRFTITLENKALPANPRTSWLAALSVEQAVLRHFSSIKL